MNNSQPANILTAVSFSILGTVGFIGNIILVTLLSKNLKNSQPYEKVIFATLVTDLFTSLNIACLEPLGILSHVTFFCKLSAFFYAFFTTMNLIWIAVNMFSRYLALYNSERYHQWFNTRGILICYALAVMVNISAIAPLIYFDILGLNNMGICAVNPYNSITALFAMPGQILPFLSDIFCFVFGFFVVKKIRSHISQVGLTVDSGLVEESRQIVILVAVSAIVPFMFQFPAIVIRISQYFMNINPWFTRILQSMFPMVPASAPFITAFIIKPYRKKVIKLFSRSGKSTTNVVKISSVNHNWN